jgi:hypothetical protein
MSTAWTDERLDDEIRRFLDRRWHDVASLPSAGDISRAVLLGHRRTADRGVGTRRVLPLLAAAAALLIVAASVAFVGSQRDADVSLRPSTLPTAPASPMASAAPTQQYGPFRWHTIESEVGVFAWARVDDRGGTRGELKPGIYETPAGFATITSVEYEYGSNADDGYEESADGVTWRESTIPVPGTGPFEHLHVGDEHWLWSVSELRAWRSSDYVDWTEVDLAAISPPSSGDVDWTLDLGAPATDGSTVIIPWDQSAPGQQRSGLLVVAGDRVDSFDRPWAAEAALAWAGGRFLAFQPPTATFGSQPATPGALWESPDGRAWTYRGEPEGLPVRAGPTVQLIDGRDLAVGYPLVATLDTFATSELWGSEDGIAWQSIGTVLGSTFVMDGVFVAILGSSASYSVDGRAWQRLETPGLNGYEPWFGLSPYRAGPNTIVLLTEPGPAWRTWLLRFDADGSAPVPTTPGPSDPPTATIGRVSVVAAEGGWGDDIFEVPGGFTAFTVSEDPDPPCPWPCPDPGTSERTARYMESADGVTWLVGYGVDPEVPGE